MVTKKLKGSYKGSEKNDNTMAYAFKIPSIQGSHTIDCRSCCFILIHSSPIICTGEE